MTASQSTTTQSGPLHGEITRRAREIWNEEGRPEGRALQHWLRAESELKVSIKKHQISVAPPAASHSQTAKPPIGSAKSAVPPQRQDAAPVPPPPGNQNRNRKGITQHRMH